MGGANFDGQIYVEIVPYGGTNDQIMPRESGRGELHKIHFQVI